MNIEKDCSNCGQGDGCSWKSKPGYSMYEKCITKDHACWFPDIFIENEILKDLLRQSQKCIEQLVQKLQYEGYYGNGIDLGNKLWYDIYKEIGSDIIGEDGGNKNE
jgi:hypothetical protein